MKIRNQHGHVVTVAAKDAAMVRKHIKEGNHEALNKLYSAPTTETEMNESMREGGLLPYYNSDYGVMPYNRPQLGGGGFTIGYNEQDMLNMMPYARPQMEYGGMNIMPYGYPQMRGGGNVLPYAYPQMQYGGFYDKRGNFTYRNPNKDMVWNGTSWVPNTDISNKVNHMSAKRSDRIGTRSLKNMDGFDDEDGNLLPQNQDSESNGFNNPGYGGFDVATAAEGDYLGKAAYALGDMGSAQSPAQMVADVHNLAWNLPKGILKTIGDYKTTDFTKNYENNLQFNQLNGTMREPFATYTPDRLHGDMAHPLQNKYGGKTGRYQVGGVTEPKDKKRDLISSILPYQEYLPDNVNDFKSDRMNSTAEVEGRGKGRDGEVLKIGNLVGAVSGPEHSEDSTKEGGVPINVPGGTKVLSDHLKLGDKTYAEEGKKYSTEKFLGLLKNKYIDPITKDTAELSIEANNSSFDKLYNVMQHRKRTGAHGKSIQKKTIQEDQMEQMNAAPEEATMVRVGGFIPKFQGGGGTNPNTGLKGTSNFDGDIDQLYNYLISNNYKGKKDIGEMQDWAIARNPRLIADYMAMVRPNEKAFKIWNENMTALGQPLAKDYKEVDMSKLSPEDRIRAFGDKMWDYRYPKGDYSIPGQSFEIPAKLTGQGRIVSQEPDTLAMDKITGNKAQRHGAYGIPIPVPKSYAIDPLHTRQLDYKHINYRPVEIERAINEANQQVRATQRFLPVGSQGIGNINNSFAEAWRNKAGVYGDDFNRRQQGMLAVDQFNAQQDRGVDASNMQEFQLFRDLQARRDGAVSTQNLMDADLGNYFKNRQYGESSDYINRTFNPLGYNNTEFTPGAKYNFETSTSDKDANTVTYRDAQGRVIKTEKTYPNDKKLGGKVKSILKKRKK